MPPKYLYLEASLGGRLRVSLQVRYLEGSELRWADDSLSFIFDDPCMV